MRHEPDYDSFSTSPEWTNIVNLLREMRDESQAEMITAAAVGNVNQVQFLAGRVAQINDLINIPEYMNSIVRHQKQGVKNAADQKRDEDFVKHGKILRGDEG